MGSCQCKEGVVGYLERRNNEKVGVIPVCETPVQNFDSLKNQTSPRVESVIPTEDITNNKEKSTEEDTDIDSFLDGSTSDFGSETFSDIYESHLIDQSLSPEDIVRKFNESLSNNRPFMCSRLGQNSDSLCSDLTDEEVLQWKKGYKIGSGSFGQVYCGMTIEGELLAVKQIHIDTSDLKVAEKEYTRIYEEVRLLKSLLHDNIVGYYGSSFEQNTISIFMEYVPGGSLANILEKFGALECRVVVAYTRQLLNALNYLHSKSIVHRDVKSANVVLMAEGTVKLIDFGCSKRLAIKLGNSNLAKSIRGTAHWMAPEIINQEGHGKKADIWSLGCTVYEMFTGKPPWGDREPVAAIYAVGANLPIPPLPDMFSDEAKEFTSLCMIRDKFKRPTSQQLLDHPFLCKKSGMQSKKQRQPELGSNNQIEKLKGQMTQATQL